MTEITGTFEIAKLELRKGDSLVVRVDLVLSRDQEDYIRRHFEQYVPDGVGLIVLGKDMTLAVLQAH